MSYSDIDTSLVTVGQPVDGGCCYTCFDEEPTLPTSASSSMASAQGWESLGELSQNGYTEGTQINSQTFRGWHGSVVLAVVNEETHTYRLEFIEVSRTAVAKVRYGIKNIQTDADGNVVEIDGKSGQLKPLPLVIDELESNGWKRRTVVKKAQITAIDDTPHQKGDLMVYGLTFTAAEVDGSPFKIYRAKPAQATPGEDGDEETGDPDTNNGN